MKDQSPDMLDETIRSLRKTGGTFKVAAADSETLNTVQLLSELPKRAVPEPVMQRKYLTAAAVKQHVWFAWMHVSRFTAASVSFALLVALFGTTAYASFRSLPGQKLFTLKRSAEQLQLSLQRNPVERANVQMAIAQKRLKEAERIFGSESKNPKLEAAALTELSRETQKSIDVLRSAANQNQQAETTTTIVAKVEDITQKQQALLQTIEPQAELQVAAAAAISTSKSMANEVQEIKKSIEIAGTLNEQALTTLTPATTTPDSALSTASSTPDVKGISTTSKPTIISKPSTTPVAIPETATSTASSTPADPNAAIGGFIIEDPAPQFAP